MQIKKTYCRETIVPVWDEGEASRFWHEIDDKVRLLAQHTGIEGKNTLEKMKKLNKFVKTPRGKWFKKTVYKIKDDIILLEIKRKGKILADEGENMTYKITQSGVQVGWHLADFRKKLIKLWRIKKQE